MKTLSYLINNKGKISRRKYLVLIMFSLFINFSCNDSGSKQKVTAAPTSIVSSQEDFLKSMIPYFKQSGKLYRKYKKVYARKAVKGEKILTITDDGLETFNTAKDGDFVVKNQTDAQEMYNMSSKNFNKRYRLLREAEDGFSEYLQIGKVIGLELTISLLAELELDTEFNFIAPWGEKMVAKKGDYIVSPPEFNEVYRIARKEFFETYELDQN